MRKIVVDENEFLMLIEQIAAELCGDAPTAIHAEDGTISLSYRQSWNSPGVDKASRVQKIVRYEILNAGNERAPS